MRSSTRARETGERAILGVNRVAMRRIAENSSEVVNGDLGALGPSTFYPGAWFALSQLAFNIASQYC
jgi:hypothetical protein